MPSVAIVPNVFSVDECAQIIKLGKKLAVQKANIEEFGNGFLNEKYRNGKIAVFSPEDEEFAWVYQKSVEVFRDINDAYWGFELEGSPDHMQFTIYEEGDFYDWHLDIGEGESDTGNRKISSVVQLVEPASYEGGELELFVGQEERSAPKDLGCMIIFPAYSLHRVRAIQKGIRYSLVHWMSGKTPYK